MKITVTITQSELDDAEYTLQEFADALKEVILSDLCVNAVVEVTSGFDEE